MPWAAAPSWWQAWGALNGPVGRVSEEGRGVSVSLEGLGSLQVAWCVQAPVAERGRGEERAWRRAGCCAGATGGVGCRAREVVGAWRWGFRCEDGKAHGGLLSPASCCVS